MQIKLVVVVVVENNGVYLLHVAKYQNNLSLLGFATEK